MQNTFQRKNEKKVGSTTGAFSEMMLNTSNHEKDQSGSEHRTQAQNTRQKAGLRTIFHFVVLP
jgi:hypothetical protein